jgi:short subunit dehydrogenase-like uncharacterized protein
MSIVSDRAWVVVYGATGYVGRLLCRALRRRNIRFAIAGRSAHKLALLSEALGGVEQQVVDLESRASVSRLLDRRLLVCACAGPFSLVGEPLLAAAAELGVHYVDVGREQPFARAAFERYDAAARASKACIVPSLALPVAPADWAAHLLAERLGGALDSVDVLYAVRAPDDTTHATRGAVRSAIATLARGDAWQYVDGAVRPERDAAVVRRFTTRSFGEVTATSTAGVEAIVVPTHVAVRGVRAFREADPFVARVFQAARGLAPFVARAGQGAMERLLAYAAEGPGIDARARTTFEIVAEGRRGAATATVHLTGRDPLAVTAEIQAHAADAALNGYVTASGVVSPSVGYPALAALANLGDVLQAEIAGERVAPVRSIRAVRSMRARVA